MPRRPRIHLNDVPLHIVQRGHNREPCFFAEARVGCNNRKALRRMMNPIRQIKLR